MEVLIVSIGDNIKKYRKEKDYTQRELADMLGVSVQAVSKWETDAGAPDISLVVPLASALDISTDALFDFECCTKPEDFEKLSKDYRNREVFRNQTASVKDYKMLNDYFNTHPLNPEAASLCLKSLVEMIVGGKVQDRAKSELVLECEKYANCVFKYESNADALFMNHFVLARGYSALGENDKAQEILAKIPVSFGDRLYWEAEIAQANKEYDKAMLKCRSSFALKARYISRCIRMAGEIFEANGTEEGFLKRMEYEEYMLRIIDAFLSGGEYLPCRQVFQKYILLHGMVRKYIQLHHWDNALKKAEMLFAGREEFLNFLDNQQGKSSLLFENDDSEKYLMETKYRVNHYVNDIVEFLKNCPEYESDSRIKELLNKYNLI